MIVERFISRVLAGTEEDHHLHELNPRSQVRPVPPNSVLVFFCEVVSGILVRHDGTYNLQACLVIIHYEAPDWPVRTQCCDLYI